MSIYIGIDNGVSGSVGVINKKDVLHFAGTPTKSEQNYTKAKQNITRVDTVKLRDLLIPYASQDHMVLMERPLVNPGRFKATTSALRAFESTLVVLEGLFMRFQYIDSKEWQKELLPSGIKGPKELKKAGVDVAKRLFPKTEVKKDADGLLIAEYARRKFMPTELNTKD